MLNATNVQSCCVLSPSAENKRTIVLAGGSCCVEEAVPFCVALCCNQQGVCSWGSMLIVHCALISTVFVILIHSIIRHQITSFKTIYVWVIFPVCNFVLQNNVLLFWWKIIQLPPITTPVFVIAQLLRTKLIQCLLCYSSEFVWSAAMTGNFCFFIVSNC